MKHTLILSAACLAACVTTEPSTKGSVYEITEKTVTIRGTFTYGQTAKPTQAMITQAKEICPSAQYVSANPTPSDYDTFLYLFRC